MRNFLSAIFFVCIFIFAFSNKIVKAQNDSLYLFKQINTIFEDGIENRILKPKESLSVSYRNDGKTISSIKVINQKGIIDMPFMGPVKISGLTMLQTQKNTQLLK